MIPHDALNFMKDMPIVDLKSCMNCSLLIVQPAETEGKYPQRFEASSLDVSYASALKFAWKK